MDHISLQGYVFHSGISQYENIHLCMTDNAGTYTRKVSNTELLEKEKLLSGL